MNIPEGIVNICWIVFLLYWIINWGKVKRSQNKRHTGALRIVYIAIVIGLVLNLFGLQNALHISLCTQDPRGCHAYVFPGITGTTLVTGITGAILTITGLIIAIVARRTLADNWSAVPELKKQHSLVTSGIYSYIRHPIYTGMLCMGFGTLLVYPVVQAAAFCLILLIMFLSRIPREERLMSKTFPKEYPSYRKRTKALIPFIY